MSCPVGGEDYGTDGVTLERFDHLELPARFYLAGTLGNRLLVQSFQEGGLWIVDPGTSSIHKLLDEVSVTGVEIRGSQWITIGRRDDRIVAMALNADTLAVSDLLPPLQSADGLSGRIVSDVNLAAFTWPTPEGSKVFVTEGDAGTTYELGPMESVIDVCRVDQQLLLLGRHPDGAISAYTSSLSSHTLRHIDELTGPRDISCLEDIFLVSAAGEFVDVEPFAFVPDDN